MSYSRATIIRTVAAQEVRTAARNKAIIFSLVIIMVGLVGACGLFSWLSNREATTPHLALVGMTAPEFRELSGTPGVEVSAAPGREEALGMVEGEADAALIYSQGAWELLADGTPDATIAAAAEAAAQAEAHRQALSALDVSPEAYAQALPAAEVAHTNIGTDKDFSAIVSTVIGLAVVCYFIMLFAGNIGGRVTEEKSSRVIEIILASARPLDFLAGKLVGNLAVGLLSTLLVSAVGVASLLLTGLADDLHFRFSLVPLFAVTYLLGMLFFGSLWAAAGSLVSRTEDLAATQSPLLGLVFATFYAPFIGMDATDSTLMHVLSWVPPFSLSLAPTQYAAEEMGLLQLTASYAILALSVVAVLWLAARIYRRSILRNGQKGTWLAAIRGR
ncbi:ABC transporter permease [Corynebacterium mastitidis]|uniref:ABC transporter permease n=1 Tax=Corynebacterium mastitidis TaxID=161890 RepID=UPI00035EA368|nr:ABC transporter permease [Corynebacterium mastitidis]